MQTTWSQFFFSSRGRFSRSQYWGATLGGSLILLVLAIPIMIADPDTRRSSEPGDTYLAIYAFLFLVAFGALAMAHVFALVKRFHDRDKSWLWIFIYLVPLIGGLWILIECGCLAGTPDDNAYGPPSFDARRLSP